MEMVDRGFTNLNLCFKSESLPPFFVMLMHSVFIIERFPEDCDRRIYGNDIITPRGAAEQKPGGK